MYSIEGTKNLNLKIYKHEKIIVERPYINFNNEFEEFKNLLIKQFNNDENITYIHFGDGDYYFLRKEAVGSATPGKRALSIPYNKFDITPFIEGFNKNDYICIEVLKHNLLDKYNTLFPKNIINGKGKNIDYNSKNRCIPTEFLYGIVSNKWIFKQFSGSIGLIGADSKLDLIKKLMEYKEYQEYLGIEKFNDYISIPQKFACDNLEKIKNDCKEQMKNSTSKIFLVGIGHVKSGLYHHFKTYKNAIYIDVGIYIDAIAGLIDYKRPYAAGWINYKIKNFDYKKIDDLQYVSRPENEKIIL